MTIGYHASHEQFPPATLLGLALRAEQAGFEALMCSDHFHPWTTAQGQSGHSWVWAGALAVQSALTLGMVTCPMLRQHPALVAQAAATLEQLAPGRIWLALGTGEALNERITGQPWPAKRERQKALRDAAEVMRRLWGGEQVDHDGGFRVRQARLYSRPALPLPLLGAAVTEETARWMGGGEAGAAWHLRRILQVVEAQVAGASCWHGDPVGTDRIAVLEVEGQRDMRVLVARIEDAAGFVTLHLRRRAVAPGWNVAFGDSPASMPDAGGVRFHDAVLAGGVLPSCPVPARNP